MSDIETRDVCIVGGGVAGLTAGIFTARAGLDTLILDSGESILARNAHLENVPGFPAGVNARRFLEMTRDQAERNGCTIREARVTSVDPADRDTLTPDQERLLIRKALQHRTWATVADGLHYRSPTECKRALSTAVRALIETYGDEFAHAELERLG